MKRLSLFLFFSIFFISGCSIDLFNFTNNKCDSLDKYNQICNKYDNKYECAVGEGSSYEDAIKNAKLKITQNALTIVKAFFEKKVKEQNSVVKKYISETKEFSSLNFSYLELEGIKVLKKVKSGKCYYVVILVSKDKINKAIKDFMKKSDAIMYVSLIERTKDLNLKLKYLSELADIVKAKNLYEDTVVVNGSVTTFKAYIDLVLSKVSKKLIPIFTGDKVYIVSKQNYFPLVGVKFVVKDVRNREMTFVTDEEGKILIPQSFRIPISLYLKVGNEKYLIATLMPKNLSRIYISTKPVGLNYEILKNGRVISSGSTPNMVEVNGFGYYKIILLPTKDYRGIEQLIYVKKGFDAYFFRKMEKLRFANVELKADGDSVLYIRSADGRLIARGVSEFKSKLPTGSYKVVVKRSEDSIDYQKVYDNLVLFENDKLKREYFEPKDRDFYRRGFGWFLAFSKQTPESVKINGSKYYGDKSKYDQNIIYFGGKKYWTYTFLGGGIGFASYDDDDTSGDSSTGFYLDSILGFYVPFSYGDIEIGGGYEYFNSSKDYYNYKVVSKFSEPFVSLKVNILKGLLGFEVRKFKNADTQFILSLGVLNFHSGYKLPREVEAIKGRDYE